MRNCTLLLASMCLATFAYADHRNPTDLLRATESLREESAELTRTVAMEYGPQALHVIPAAGMLSKEADDLAVAIQNSQRSFSRLTSQQLEAEYVDVQIRYQALVSVWYSEGGLGGESEHRFEHVVDAMDRLQVAYDLGR